MNRFQENQKRLSNNNKNIKNKYINTATYVRNSTKTMGALFLEKQKKYKHKNFSYKIFIHANVTFQAVAQ